MAKKKVNYRDETERWFGYRPQEPATIRVSASRVIKLWKLVYDADVRKIDGYKANRHSRVLYNVYDEKGNLFIERVPLLALLKPIEDEYYNSDY